MATTMNSSNGAEAFTVALEVRLTPAQAERLIDDPEKELVLHYSDGTKVIVRISKEYEMVEDETMH